LRGLYREVNSADDKLIKIKLITVKLRTVNRDKRRWTKIEY
jgi:hypothetical protein